MPRAQAGRIGQAMTEVLGFLSIILGPLMALMYQAIPSYALTMIIFTILIRVVSLPLAIKQQKSMAKMSVYTPMLNEIQQKYKNNPEKQNEELMKFQQEYGYNPMAGCLPMLLNMLILFAIIQVVYHPVRYILGIPTDAINAACTALGISTSNVTLAETQLITAIKAGTDVATGLTAEQIGLIQGFNTTFLGMDVCTTAGFTLSPLLIFPILATITVFASNIIVTRMNGQQAATQGSMKIMLWVMNLMFAWFCFTAPIGFSLYYTTSNICMILQSVLTNKVYSPERFKAEYEAELAAKKAAKKAKKEVVVVEEGQEVTKQVNEAELNRLRLERARALDAEKYKDERTRPLTEAERAELEAQSKSKKKKGGK